MACSGECCVCFCSGGGCLAGRKDDYFHKATKEQVISRLDNGSFPSYRGDMIAYLKKEFGIDYEHDKAAGVLELKQQVGELTDKVKKLEDAIKAIAPMAFWTSVVTGFADMCSTTTNHNSICNSGCCSNVQKREVKEMTLAEIEAEINELESCGSASEFYISNMRNAITSIKEGDTVSAFKFLIIVLLEPKGV